MVRVKVSNTYIDMNVNNGSEKMNRKKHCDYPHLFRSDVFHPEVFIEYNG